MVENMTRHEMRLTIFCLLFQNEFYGTEAFEEQKENFLQTRSVTEKEYTEITEKVQDLIGHLPQIDEMISAHSKNWKIDRIAKAELAILRLAVYEAKYDESVPVGVAINEAVELAKEYGEDNGAAFVNGVLGQIVNE